jgi:photosystem II stability/assembly factor-like uncharacterized protein
MKRILLALSLLALATTAFAQHWEWVSPLPQGNTLNDLAFRDADHAVAVGDANTIVYSNDGGESWHPYRQSLGQPVVDLNHILFTDALHGWMYNASRYSEDTTRLYHTTDGGATWPEFEIPSVRTVTAISFSDPQHGVIACKPSTSGRHSFLLHTRDCGMTWDSLSADSFSWVRHLDFVDSLEGWMVQWHTIRHTLDGGLTWSELPLSVGGEGILSLCRTDSYHLQVLGNYFTLWKSSDGGASWDSTATGRALDGIQFEDSLHGYAYSDHWGVAPFSRTTDGGSTWEACADLARNQIRGVVAGPSGGVWVVGTSGSLLHSTDHGFTWIRQAGATDMSCNDAAFTSPTNGWFAAGHDLLHTVTGDNQWLSVVHYDSLDFSEVYFLDSLYGWALDDDNLTLIRTTDGGAVWYMVCDWTYYPPPPENPSWFSAVYFRNPYQGWLGYSFDGDEHHMWYAELNYSLDGGHTWEPAPGTHGNPGPMAARKVSFGDSLNGWLLTGAAFFRSTDGGVNWTEVETPPELENKYDIAPVGLNHCWATLDAQVAHTSDGGATWEIQNNTEGAQLVTFADTLNGWAWCWHGEFLFTTDGGQNWIRDSLVTMKNVQKLGNCGPGHAWAIGPEGQILRYREHPIPPDEAPQSAAAPPLSYRFSAAPNPFNPSTELSLTVPVRTHVTIDIFNLLGRKVETLTDQPYAAGQYRFRFDGSNLPSGLYFARLTAGQTTRTQKLMLLK